MIAFYLMVISKNLMPAESAANFPSFVTNFLRVAPATRAKICLD